MKKFLRTIFLADLIEGLWVTFRNQKPSLIYTEQYPAERPKVAERYRGAPRLNINPENGETLWRELRASNVMGVTRGPLGRDE